MSFHPQRKTHSFSNVQGVDPACSGTAGWRHMAAAHSFSYPTLTILSRPWVLFHKNTARCLALAGQEAGWSTGICNHIQ